MKKILASCAALCLMASCLVYAGPHSARIDIIFDTDANNELDDQHAIAYLLMNPETFRTLAITTNNTKNGGGIAGQSEEARRIVTLAGRYGKGIKVIDGAESGFEDISETLDDPGFDGHKAVDFIIRKARKYTPEHKLTLIAVGKLTNVALALKKAPEIAQNINLVWLGSNYPNPGEYNLVDDIPSMNYVLDTDIDFEIVTVRYNLPTGTAAVKIRKEYAEQTFTGKGPKIKKPIEGRHGGSFNCFGDYSVDLFRHIRLENGTRSLFDLCAVAVVKNPQWGKTVEIPAPTMVDRKWTDRPDNPRKIIIWENFDRDGIVSDFVGTLERATR